MSHSPLRFAGAILVGALVCLSVPARLLQAASLEVTLDNPAVTAAPGDTVTFTGSLRNPAPIGTPPVLPNADYLTVDLPLSGDYSAFVSFLLGLPAPTLGPGELVSLELFAIQVPGDAPAGTYFGAFDVL